jgi:hypothetical protein
VFDGEPLFENFWKQMAERTSLSFGFIIKYKRFRFRALYLGSWFWKNMPVGCLDGWSCGSMVVNLWGVCWPLA